MFKKSLLLFGLLWLNTASAYLTPGEGVQLGPYVVTEYPEAKPCEECENILQAVKIIEKSSDKYEDIKKLAKLPEEELNRWKALNQPDLHFALGTIAKGDQIREGELHFILAWKKFIKGTPADLEGFIQYGIHESGQKSDGIRGKVIKRIAKERNLLKVDAARGVTFANRLFIYAFLGAWLDIETAYQNGEPAPTFDLNLD